MTSMPPTALRHAAAAAAAHSGGNGLLTLLAIVITIVVIGWRISLRRHPNTDCAACGGSGKHRGAIFKKAYRQCDACHGHPTRYRRGAKGGGR